jgi:hypothetical protein
MIGAIAVIIRYAPATLQDDMEDPEFLLPDIVYRNQLVLMRLQFCIHHVRCLQLNCGSDVQ